ncbi:carboxymuconolactone decarboxylase family protein [Nitrospinota bacterium]
MDSLLLLPREKAAVLWAEHVTNNTARNRDDVFEEVRRHFDDAEIVELTLMSGIFNMFSRFMDSLRVPVEVSAEVDKIKTSVHLDPANVKVYFESVIRNWPEEFPAPRGG